MAIKKEPRIKAYAISRAPTKPENLSSFSILVLLDVYRSSTSWQASYGDIIRFHCSDCYRCRLGNINVSSARFGIAATAAATAADNAAAVIVAVPTVAVARLRAW